MTHAATRLVAVEMRGPWASFAAPSKATPSHVAPLQTRAQASAVLADASGEHDGVESAERRRQRSELAPDAIHEEIDRCLRGRIVGRFERPHVAGNPGHAEKARLRVQKLLDGARIHLE